jgi:prolyl oligopeptidase
VVDDYHGTLVPDPYRSLEDDDDPATRKWTAEQAALAEAYLATLPERDGFRRRLAELWDYARVTPPVRRGGWLFFERNDGLQPQPVLYRQPVDGGEPLVVLDPNALSEDGTVALVSYSPSDDGRYLACNLSSGGSDWQTIRVLEVATGEALPDELRWCKFTSAAWKPDGSGFYYARYPAPGEVPDAAPSTHQRVCFHALRTDQRDDPIVHARPAEPNLGFHPVVAEGGDYLFLELWTGASARSGLAYRPLEPEGAPLVPLLDVDQALYQLLGNDGPLLYLLTDLGAPLGRIVAIDLRKPQRSAWRELVPEGEDAIEDAAMIGDGFVVNALHHARHRLARFALDGSPLGEVPLPGLGSLTDLRGRRRDPELFATFSSFLHAPSVLRIDPDTGESRAYHRSQVGFDPSAFETRQVFVESRDGTRLPLFLTHARGLETSGAHPTLLYGYGGFNVSMTPTFSPSRLAWLERGGVYAHAVLRGGREYGDAWHVRAHARPPSEARQVARGRERSAPRRRRAAPPPARATAYVAYVCRQPRGGVRIAAGRRAGGRACGAVEARVRRHQVPQLVERVDRERHDVVEIVAPDARGVPVQGHAKRAPSSMSRSTWLRSQSSGRRLSGRSVRSAYASPRVTPPDTRSVNWLHSWMHSASTHSDTSRNARHRSGHHQAHVAGARPAARLHRAEVAQRPRRREHRPLPRPA